MALPQLTTPMSDTNTIDGKSDYRFEKVKNKMFSKESSRLCRNFLLSKFEAVNKCQDYSHFFTIPANTLSSEELMQILNQLNKFKILRIDVESHVYDAVLKDPMIAEQFSEWEKLDDKKLAFKYLKQFVILLDTLREFVIVEYLNSLNQPVSESLIHNLGFHIDPVEGEFKVMIELEHWEGKESETVEMKDGEVEDNVYGVMKHFEGGDFDTLITGIAKFEAPKSGRYVRSILDSLSPLAQSIDFINSTTMEKRVSKNGMSVIEKVNKLNFGHYDIKPNNIFVKRLRDNITGHLQYNLVLGDFGSALRPIRPNEDIRYGTDDYMAPEIISGDYGDNISRADVYSFAVTLYQLILGKKPETYLEELEKENVDRPDKFILSGNDTADTNLLYSYDDEDILVNRELATHGNEGNILRILSRGMSLHPQDRYGTCSEMIDDLLEEIAA